MDKLIIWIMDAKSKAGIIMQGSGEAAQEDITACGTNDLDDYDFSKYPNEEGLYYWEGKLIGNGDDSPTYAGTWRKATSKDLIELKVIDE